MRYCKIPEMTEYERNYNILLNDKLKQDELNQEYLDRLKEIKEEIVTDFFNAVGKVASLDTEIEYKFIEKGISFAVDVSFKRNTDIFPLALCNKLTKTLSSEIYTNRRARVKINYNKSYLKIDDGVVLHIAFMTTPEDYFSESCRENECITPSCEECFVSLQKNKDYDF